MNKQYKITYSSHENLVQLRIYHPNSSIFLGELGLPIKKTSLTDSRKASIN